MYHDHRKIFEIAFTFTTLLAIRLWLYSWITKLKRIGRWQKTSKNIKTRTWFATIQIYPSVLEVAFGGTTFSCSSGIARYLYTEPLKMPVHSSLNNMTIFVLFPFSQWHIVRLLRQLYNYNSCTLYCVFRGTVSEGEYKRVWRMPCRTLVSYDVVSFVIMPHL